MNLNPLRRSEDFSMTRPTDLFEDLVRDLWSPMFAPMLASRGGEGLRRFSPRVNLTEKADAYELEVEVPGVRPEDVNINLIGDTLTIQGEKSQEEGREEDTWHVTERSYGAFQRSFTFPAHVDPDKVEATNENGLLKIRVAKTKESQPRRIEIRAGKGGQKQLDTSATEVSAGASGKAESRTESKSEGKQGGGKR